MVKSKILEAFDFERADDLLEGFNKSTGFVTAIMDLDGKILSKSRWREICTDFHHKNPETLSKCFFKDRRFRERMSEEEIVHSDGCLNGLTDVVIPIVIRGEHIANLFSGQFFLEEPDRSFYKSRARRYGFEEKAYLEALERVPVFTKEGVEAATRFLQLIVKTLIDMTVEKLEQMEMKNELMHSRDLMRYIIEHNRSAVAVHDRELNYLYVSQRYLDDYRVKEKDIIGKHHYEVFPDLPQKWREVHQRALKGEILRAERDLFIRDDGTKDWTRWECRPWYEKDGTIGGIILYTEVITDQIRIENRLRYLSYNDHLTGLRNRRYFEEELKNVDTQENLPLSVMMCDVNGLKLVNDSFGHDAGDLLLKKAAEIIRKVSREKDLIARMGGDEFVLLLPNTTAGETVDIANRIKELASMETVANVELSISYGYETKTAENQSMTEMIGRAENHMYRHKLHERSSIRSRTIDLIMNTLFEKSDREAAHSRRVSKLCRAIAEEMGLNKDVVNQVRIAGLIHDIGKIGIDEKILNKSGGLTFEERREIERHPEIGWRLLRATNEFSQLAQILLNHHERWDGSGYPGGIKGEAIQIEARIIAVADAYDAMTSKRSYKKEMSKKEAVKELEGCAGTHFDPVVVDVFLHRVLRKEAH